MNKNFLKEAAMKKVGMDAGGSFVKIAFQEHSSIHKRVYSNEQVSEAVNWLKFLVPDVEIAVTGGRAEEMKNLFGGNAVIIPEFTAIEKGTEFIMKSEVKRSVARFLMVMAGTGTSLFLVENGVSKRLLGTGLGGGTFTGLGSILTKENDYIKLAELAKKGDRTCVDLMVSDIYSGSDSPLSKDLTASNFGKADKESPKSDSLTASLVNMIAETLSLLVIQAANSFKVEDVVFLGGAFDGNPVLKEITARYHQRAGITPYFPASGRWAGAIGAMLS
jgi:type II pantothenate kinase